MTGHQINSLVGDLVAMAQAMERLPQVEADLANAKDHSVDGHSADAGRTHDHLSQPVAAIGASKT